jgi:hypothetical protein
MIGPDGQVKERQTVQLGEKLEILYHKAIVGLSAQ